MSQTPESARPNLRRQLRQALDAMTASGIHYIPAAAKREFSFHIAGESSAYADESPEVAENSLSSTTSLEDRRIALAQLAQEVSRCDRCPELFSTRTQTVFGVGNIAPELCFVGEAPGADEDRIGEPFVGAAGQLLTKIIIAMGLSREEVYICNTLKCRPPRNATPTPEQCANCRPFFTRQLELLAPKFICCLGGTAAQNVLGTTTGIMRLRGKVHDLDGTPVVCTFHPSALLRKPEWKKDTWDDMKMLLKLMGRTVPSTGGK